LFLPRRRDNAGIRRAWSDLPRTALGGKSSSPVKWIPKIRFITKEIDRAGSRDKNKP
jgi:hypothetical protein